MQQLLQDNQNLTSRVEKMSRRGQNMDVASVSMQWIAQKMSSNGWSDADIARLQESIGGLLSSGIDISAKRRHLLEKRFLQQLQYDDMHSRQETLEDAHKETFRWIFDNPDTDRPGNGGWANFREWLNSSEQLYWITGKPGAGKSTLMKFIWDSLASDDASHLDLQPKEKHLTMANFYFWAAGSSMQRSREGLYRTLLYQLLQQHTQAIPGSSPDRWEALCLFGDAKDTFTEHELQSMLRNCFGQLKDTDVCLFIDGLDEFSGHHDDLVRFFSNLIEDYPVRLCLSSRPWDIFEEAFQDKPSLHIHELTHGDIEAYVTSQFENSPSFVALQSRDRPYTDHLVQEILRRAQGVFLWVKLVVASLVEGLREGDTRNETQRRLDHLPDGLEDLFHRILQDLKPENQRRAAMYLGFMSLYPDPPLALVLSFAEEDDPEFALKLPVLPLSDSAIEERTAMLSRRIKAACRGLLELTRYLDPLEDHQFPRVQYCHRSVKDYVETTRVKDLLAGHKELNHYVRICSGSLALRKSLGGNGSRQEVRELRVAECHCLSVAAFVPKSDTAMMIRILDELEKSCSEQLDFGELLVPLENNKLHFGLRAEGVSRDSFTQHMAKCWHYTYKVISFLSVAVQCNALEWLRHRLAQYCDRRRFSLAAFRALISSNVPPSSPNLDALLFDAVMTDIPSPAMIEFLLRSGASPAAWMYPLWYEGRPKAKGPSNFSIWDATVMLIIVAFRVDPDASMRGRVIWRQVAQSMAAHGASVSKRTVRYAMDLLATAEYEIKSVREDMNVEAVLNTGLKVLTAPDGSRRGRCEIPEWRLMPRAED